MKSAFMKMICRLLVVSLMAMPFSAAQAGMIGTDRAAAVTSAQADRAAVLAMVSRAEVQEQLAARGIDPKSAGDRVAAMTDSEVRSLANQLDSVPAGARSNGWAWAAVIIIGIIVWYNWK
jgi:hypothetical protein